jgi:hypothetical protein
MRSVAQDGHGGKSLDRAQVAGRTAAERDCAAADDDLGDAVHGALHTGSRRETVERRAQAIAQRRTLRASAPPVALMPFPHAPTDAS